MSFDSLKSRSIQICHQLENKRILQQKSFEQLLGEVEARRKQEISQMLQKEKDLQDHVRMLRGIVDIIRSDQQVQQIEKLKAHIAEQQVKFQQLAIQNKEILQSHEFLISENEANKQQVRQLQNQLEIVQAQLKAADNSRDFCRNCQVQIIGSAKQIGQDLKQKVIMAKQQIDKVEALKSNSSGQQVNVENKLQEQLFELDFSDLFTIQLHINEKMKKIQQISKMEEDMKRKDNEIQRLRQCEIELDTLRKAYKQVITRT